MDMNGDFRILPSIASADQMRIAGEIQRLGDWPYLHLDIEDGNFVPNITFGMKTVRQIASYTEKELDAHLMVADPGAYLEELAGCGVKNVAVHLEALPYPLQTLSAIHKLGMRAGLALGFSSGAEAVMPFLSGADYLRVMTAEPDGEGQIFRARTLEKIRALSRLTARPIWVDGGVGPETIVQAARAGASAAVLGRAVFSAENPGERARELAAMVLYQNKK